MTFNLGLTGSIGMGKSTTAKMFADAGCALWDADDAVHRLYSKGGSAVAPIKDQFSDAIVDGAVSRDRLKEIISSNPTALKLIEQIVHPLVRQDRANFMETAQTDITVFDIPLLYELGTETEMDGVAVVTVPYDIQKQRVLDRGTMDETQFQMIVKKQMPDAEKRALADYVILTDTVEHAREQVDDVIKDIRQRLRDA